MRQGLLQIAVLLTGMMLGSSLYAQDHDAKLTRPAFKLQKNENPLAPRVSSPLLIDNGLSLSSQEKSTVSELGLRSYDAIFYYPLHRRGVSIDLGVNFRLQEDNNAARQPYNGQQDWLNIDPAETRTRLHAEAIFDLPFSGLQAGVSGSYQPNTYSLEYDYQAKLSYKWKNGFGLQGGWQHQQRPLEQPTLNETLDVQTLFLDLNYRF